MALKTNWDLLGIATSVGCAIHCALLPLVASTLPVFGINIIHNSYFEWGMIWLAFVVGVYALVHGYKTHHKNTLPLILFLVGFILLAAKQFYNQQEVYFLMPAIILMIAAHYINFILCKRSKCTSPHHAH